MDIDQIVSLIRGENLTVKILENGTPVITPSPSAPLLKIIKGHREAVIAAANAGLLSPPPKEHGPMLCGGCKSWIHDRDGAEYLCELRNLCHLRGE